MSHLGEHGEKASLTGRLKPWNIGYWPALTR